MTLDGSGPEQRLAGLGLRLPEVAPPAGDYVAVVRHGDLVRTAGQVPFVDGTVATTGTVDDQVGVEQAQELARTCVLNALAAIRGEVGELASVRRVLRMGVYVASAPTFTGQSAVANGASELLGQVFGEIGRHVRTAVGVVALPLGAPVEVELVVAVA